MLFNKSIKALSIGFVAFASVACSGGLTDEQKASAEAQAEMMCLDGSGMGKKALKVAVTMDSSALNRKMAKETLSIMSEKGC
jgi:hypothetical protein